MTMTIWNIAATQVAGNIHDHYPSIRRGTILLPYLEEALVTAWIFGNENYREDQQVHGDVERIRQQLHDFGAEELGFGLHRDGTTWALAVLLDSRHLQTAMGKTLRQDLFMACVENALQQGIWRAIEELDPSQPAEAQAVSLSSVLGGEE